MAFFPNMKALLSVTSAATMTSATALGMLVTGASADAQSVGQYYAASASVVRQTSEGRVVYSNSTYDTYPYGAPIAQSFGQLVSDASASASSNDNRGGTISVRAAILQTGLFPFTSEATAKANLNYVFEVQGPDPDARVPVLFHALGTTMGTVPAQIQLSVKSDQDSDFVGLTTPDAPSFIVNNTLYFQPGNIYQLIMTGNAYVVSYYLAVGEEAVASGTIDPTFTIQGDFAKDYHFVGLPLSAIGNLAAVPEPATWAMMIGGFGLMGSAMRRRRTRVDLA